MKRLRILSLPFILVLGVSQAQAWSTRENITSLVQQGIATIKNNQKKTIAIGLVGAYGIYKIYKHINRTPMENRFGYDPHFEGLPQKKDSSQDSAYICPPGLNAHGKCITQLLKQKLQGLSYFPVSFNSRECNNVNIVSARSSAGKLVRATQTLPGIFHLNLGGLKDTEPLLYAVKHCTDLDYTVNLTGPSKGGAVTIRLLHMLSQPNTPCYAPLWKKFGLWDTTQQQPNAQKINTIKAKIKNVSLVHPLLDVPCAVQAIVNDCTSRVLGNTTKPHGHLWEKTILPFHNICTTCIPPVALLLLRTCTSYSHREQQAFDLVKEIDPSIKINVRLAQPDTMVGNEKDTDLANIINKNKNWSLDDISDTDHQNNLDTFP